MAEVIAVQFEADTKQATENINEMTEATDEAKKSTGSLLETIDSATGGLVSKFKGLTSGVKAATGGFKGLRGAIVATGIGALVVAVTAAVEWFTNFEAGVQLAEKAMNVFNSVLGQLGTALGELVKGNFSAAADAIVGIKDATIAAAQATDDLFEAERKLVELRKTNIIQNEQLRQELELQKRILEDTTLGYDERVAALERVRDISTQIQQNVINETELDKQRVEALIANENNYEKRNELELELSQIQADLIKQRGELNIIEKDAQRVEREINAQREIELEKQRMQREQAQRDAIADLESFQLRKSTELNIERETNRQILTDNKATLNALDEAVDESIQFRKQKEEELKQQQLLTVAAGVNAVQNGLGAIGDLYEGNTKAQKNISIAQATIATFQGALNAFQAAQIIPPPAGQIIGAANAAAAIAGGFAQIRKIQSTSISKNNGGGGSISSGAATSSFSNFQGADTDTIGAIPNFNPNQQPRGEADNGGFRAYVVESDITNSQARQKALQRRAIL